MAGSCIVDIVRVLCVCVLSSFFLLYVRRAVVPAVFLSTATSLSSALSANRQPGDDLTLNGCIFLLPTPDDESECGSRLGVASMFYVVEFTNEDLWPPYKTYKALEGYEQPDERWILYNIKRIFYQTDDLKKAREKCKKAESESDVLTEIEDGQDKRKRKPSKKLQFSSDSSDGTDIDIHHPKTKYPEPPTHKTPRRSTGYI